MIKNNKIRINSDLGEGTGVEKDIMPFLSSCSIACGGHTGDKSTMTDTILIAKKYGVKNLIITMWYAFMWSWILFKLKREILYKSLKK